MANASADTMVTTDAAWMIHLCCFLTDRRSRKNAIDSFEQTMEMGKKIAHIHQFCLARATLSGERSEWCCPVP